MDLTPEKLAQIKREKRDAQRGQLKRHRKSASLSQAEVAEKMGVSQQAVQKWEQKDDPGDYWPKLAKLYDVRLQYPSEPFNPEKQQEWLERRNAAIRRYKPNVPIIGAGKFSQATGKPL